MTHSGTFGGKTELVCYVGRNWNNATNAGTFYFNANNALTNSNANIGRRQLGIIAAECSLPLGKNPNLSGHSTMAGPNPAE